MTGWEKEEIEIADGTKVAAQMPVIVSASRSTDIPAFYSEWFLERLKAGYVKWFNPFNGLPLYVGFRKARLIVFWSKNRYLRMLKIGMFGVQGTWAETPRSSVGVWG